MNARLTMILLVIGAALAGCQSSSTSTPVPATAVTPQSEYVIGPGDTLQIFVWQHPEVSVTIPVRPDGRISTPLVEDVVAVGKTPTQLARDLDHQGRRPTACACAAARRWAERSCRGSPTASSSRTA